MTDQKIKLVRPCEWEEVFLEWYKNEGNRDNWNALAKERGYSSWADWRINGYARRFDCTNAAWGFYEITGPASVIRDWCGGPFRSWIEKYYGGEKTKTFAELAADEKIAVLPTLRAMMAGYPAASMITALELLDGRIFVIEGMHRCCALALMAKEGKPAPEKLIFAIGKSALSELPPVGKNDNGKLI